MFKILTTAALALTISGAAAFAESPQARYGSVQDEPGQTDFAVQASNNWPTGASTMPVESDIDRMVTASVSVPADISENCRYDTGNPRDFPEALTLYCN